MKTTSKPLVKRKQHQFAKDSRLATLYLLEDLEEEQKIASLAKAMDEALLESMGDGMISTDKEGVVNNMNRMAEKMLGVSRKELLGGKLVEVLKMFDDKGNEIPSPKRPATISLLKGKTISTVQYYRRRGGSVFPAAMIITPVILNKSIVGVIQVFRDVTNERSIDKAKTELIYLASHQLRTPLTAISWYTQLLQSKDNGHLNPKQTEFANEILSADKRMIALINSLLNVSRLEMGTFSIEPTMVDVIQLIRKTVRMFKFNIQRKNVDLAESYHPTTIPFMADTRLLGMMIQNIVSNAVKYTPSGGKIAIKVNKVSNSLNITISDTGIGIPKNQQGKIFSKLFRADNASLMDPTGTGLGLYIVKEITSNSGGKIRFKSKEGKGTTFYLTYPLSGMVKHAGTKQII